MHTICLPRSCLSICNLIICSGGLFVAVACVWCAFNTDLVKTVNYGVLKTPVNVFADFINLKLGSFSITYLILPICLLASCTSCCGLLGSCCRLKCAIKSYMCLVTLLFAVTFHTFFLTVLYSIYYDDKEFQVSLQSSFKTHYGKQDDLGTYFWNHVMVAYECCGVVDYEDFIKTPWHRDNANASFPLQCCFLQNKSSLQPVYVECPYGEHSKIYSHRNGCFQVLHDHFVSKSVLIAFMVLLYLLIYFCIIIFSYTLVKGRPLIRRSSANRIARLKKEALERVASSISTTSLQNMLFEDSEPPQKMVRLMSSMQPNLRYEYPANFNMPQDAFNRASMYNFQNLSGVPANANSEAQN
ncbi:tetraspanin-18 [Plutella xylostella]|uniref:tetraspanin-18 n=1 Tax=Plutella xylostella TaxID=51655 RepID=UPI00203305C3|nr:tetraspanin-18 [Plutella xylostella]